MRKTAVITGGGSGIGKAIGLELASQGYEVTIADRNKDNAASVAEEIKSNGGRAQSVCCDVRDVDAQRAMFDQHLLKYKTLDVVLLNAGVLERGDVFTDSDSSKWTETLDINLRAQIVGAQTAISAMQQTSSKGLIIFTASAGGIFPMPAAPVYAASKAGIVNFASSIAPRLAKRGIRVCCLCPHPVDTPMTSGAVQVMSDRSGNRKASPGVEALLPGKYSHMLLTVSQVVKGAMYLIQDENKTGTVLLLHVNGKAYEYQVHNRSLRLVHLSPAAGEFDRPSIPSKEALLRWALTTRPSTREKVQVFRLSNDFRAATRVLKEDLPELKAGQVLVRRMYAGVNASDVNFTSGRYFGSPEQSSKLLPFDAGFEAVGVVVDTGPETKGLKVGDAVAEMVYGAFSDWGVVSTKIAMPVPTCAPEIVALLTSGLTASIALEVAGQMTSGQTVLVTAAAGGTGQFVVQLAKAAGNHVIATCGGQKKAALLRRLGADRVVNYHNEKLRDVLKKEYMQGVDLVWESVGGEMFETCVRALATNGRLIVIGMMSQYASGWKPSVSKGLLERLLTNSSSVRGFFLPHHSRLYKRHLQALASKWMQGQLHVSLDPTHFVGVEKAADAVEHLQAGKSIGKVVLQLSKELPGEGPQSRL